MRNRLLITSTSFMQTPGAHLNSLKNSGFDYVEALGPLRANDLIELVSTKGPFSGIICGEDDYDQSVLEALAPHTRVISKYGVGLDRINLEVAERLKIKVFNTPGTNHSSVAELTFGLLLSLYRQIPQHSRNMHAAEWRRFTGTEMQGKTIGILGLGRVGKAVALSAISFGMKVLAFNSSWSRTHQEFKENIDQLLLNPLLNQSGAEFTRSRTIEDLLQESDIVSLHLNISKDTIKIINERTLRLCKRGAIILNPSRGGLVDQEALADALKKGGIAGYGADVVDPEPVTASNPLLNLPQVVLTPHIGSRTIEAVQRQGELALSNLLAELRGTLSNNTANQITDSPSESSVSSYVEQVSFHHTRTQRVAN